MGAVVEVVSFWVDGVPQPQGSKVPGVTKEGRPYLRDADSHVLRAWRKAIASATAAAFEGVAQISREIPVVVHVEFRFVRPKTVKRAHPTVKPDVDKLARAVLDGVGQSKVAWGDDAQVVTLRGHKVYADRAGAWVRVGIEEGAGQ